MTKPRTERDTVLSQALYIDGKRQATACVECERTLPAGTTVPPVQVAQ